MVVTFNETVWAMLAIWLAIAGGIYWLTVYRLREDWTLGVIRAGSFLGAVVTGWVQAWLWCAVCVIFFILSLFPGKHAEGGDVVDNGSR